MNNVVLQNLPENQQDMIFIDGICGASSIIFSKQKSYQEVLNDGDKGIVCMLKSLRDEPKEFIDRLKKTKYNEKTFKNALIKSKEEDLDYVDFGFYEYILRKASRASAKKTFYFSEKVKTIKCSSWNIWNLSLKDLNQISLRLKDVIIVNKNLFEILKFWNEENTIWHLSTPMFLKENKDEIDYHINILKFANDSRGKVIISGFISPLYNKSLKGWKVKKKLNAKNKEAIWFNY